MTLSRESYVLADNSKFSEIAFAKIADIHEASIITNALEDDLAELYENKTNIKVVTM